MRSSAIRAATETGLFASDVLSMFPSPTIPASMPETVPVNVGFAKGALSATTVTRAAAALSSAANISLISLRVSSAAGAPLTNLVSRALRAFWVYSVVAT